MPKKNILFIQGTGDDGDVHILVINKDGSATLGHTGSTSIYDHIQSDLFDKTSLLLDTNPNQVIQVKHFDAVFNEISDPDSHKTALMKAEGMQAKLPKNMPFFNTPENIRKTTRDNIYQLLQGINKLHVPKTVRIQPLSPSDIYDTIDKEHFEFPVIFRQAGDHGGISTIKVDNQKEQFHAFPLDGRDYYLTQFVEYKKDGLYEKFRLIVVDGEVYMRHVKYGDQWMVHNKTQISNPEELQKIVSERFLSEIKPVIQPTVTEIYNRLKLDYFGIDCHIDKDMNILIFEVNANMGIFLQKRVIIFKSHLEKIRQAVVSMIEKKITL